MYISVLNVTWIVVFWLWYADNFKMILKYYEWLINSNVDNGIFQFSIQRKFLPHTVHNTIGMLKSYIVWTYPGAKQVDNFIRLF